MTLADTVSSDSRAALAAGSRSFNAAATLLDPQTRDSTRLLYAWCRHCDDVIDGQDLGSQTLGQWQNGSQADGDSPLEQLARLRERTIASHGGADPGDPVFRAFQRVVTRHMIPLEHPLTLLDGFAMDVGGRRYESSDDTLDYAYHVAGVVGIMMARIMGVRDEATLDRACDLGIAFQLTNIARDIVDDWQAGRVYLPAEWLREEGLEPQTLGRPEHRPALARLAARLVMMAEPYYASARIGAAALPLRSAWAINGALNVYRAIGTTVRRRGPEAWTRRVTVSRLGKLGLLTLALGQSLGARLSAQAEPARASSLWTRSR